MNLGVTRVVLSGFVSACLISIALLTPANAEPDGGDSGGFTEGGVIGGVWQQDPDTRYWTNIPVGIPDSPWGFRFEPACFEDRQSGSVECLVQQRSCDAAEGGRLVHWFRGLKTSPRNSWVPFPLTEGTPVPTCVYSEKPRDVLDEIAAQILKQFQSRPVIAGELALQPSPHTLIRANTNFFVESKDQVFDFELLGQDVKIKATPTEYTWNYGDGTTYGPTRDSGYALRDNELGEETHTSHPYQEPGDYQVSVTVHFSGEYSVNGGPMIPIDGRGEFTTPAQMISVWKSESRLVSGTCLENPDGWAC